MIAQVNCSACLRGFEIFSVADETVVVLGHCKAKVCELDDKLSIRMFEYEKVGRFDISMYDAAGVEYFDPSCGVSDDVELVSI